MWGHQGDKPCLLIHAQILDRLVLSHFLRRGIVRTESRAGLCLTTDPEQRRVPWVFPQRTECLSKYRARIWSLRASQSLRSHLIQASTTAGTLSAEESTHPSHDIFQWQYFYCSWRQTFLPLSNFKTTLTSAICHLFQLHPQGVYKYGYFSRWLWVFTSFFSFSYP